MGRSSTTFPAAFDWRGRDVRMSSRKQGCRRDRHEDEGEGQKGNDIVFDETPPDRRILDTRRSAGPIRLSAPSPPRSPALGDWLADCGRSTVSERPIPGFSTEQAEIIRDGIRWRESTQDPIGLRGLNRIDVEVIDGLAYEARNPHEPDELMRVGERVERGGTGRGAGPLSHFLTGAGACLLNQFIRIAVAEGYSVTFAGATVKGEFRRNPGGAFERIACEISAAGEISDPVAEQLTERAERLCYVHSTLSRVVEMTTILVVDGRERVRRVSGPASGSVGV